MLNYSLNMTVDKECEEPNQELHKKYEGAKESFGVACSRTCCSALDSFVTLESR